MLLSLYTMMTPFCAMNRVMWLSWMRLLIMNLWDWTVDYKGTNFPWELLKHIPCLLLPSKNIERLKSSLKLWKYQVVRMSFTLFKLPWCSNRFLLGFEGINQEFISYSIHGRRRRGGRGLQPPQLSRNPFYSGKFSERTIRNSGNFSDWSPVLFGLSGRKFIAPLKLKSSYTHDGIWGPRCLEACKNFAIERSPKHFLHRYFEAQL